jgi:hypothetical protein
MRERKSVTHKDPVVRKRYAIEYQNRRYYKDPTYRARHLALVAKRGRSIRSAIRILVAEFRINGCLICPENAPCCLDAHHLDPSAKEGSVGEMSRRRASVAQVRAELLKCVCLCKNCHQKVHARLLVVPGAPELVERDSRPVDVAERVVEPDQQAFPW